MRTAPVLIGDNTFLATNVVVLRGTTVGEQLRRGRRRGAQRRRVPGRPRDRGRAREGGQAARRWRMRRVALLALLVVGVTPSAAQTPLPVDQGVIVFVREDFNAEEEPPPAFEVLDVATGTMREFLRAEDITSPSISPDGRRVAYVSNRFSRGNELRVIGIDGKGDRRVLRVAANRHICECGPGWTPDGRRLVFSVVDRNPKGGLDEPTNEIYSIGVGGHKLRRVTRNHREDGGPELVTRDGQAHRALPQDRGRQGRRLRPLVNRDVVVWRTSIASRAATAHRTSTRRWRPTAGRSHMRAASATSSTTTAAICRRSASSTLTAVASAHSRRTSRAATTTPTGRRVARSPRSPAIAPIRTPTATA